MVVRRKISGAFLVSDNKHFPRFSLLYKSFLYYKFLMQISVTDTHTHTHSLIHICVISKWVQQKMIFLRTLFFLVLVSMAISPLFVRGSRLYANLDSKMAAERATQEIETNLCGKGVEESARKVPTGSDPLHHNKFDPTSP